MRYYYSELAHISKVGGAFYKPLFFEYPDEVTQDIYSHQSRNIMLGRSIKLSILSDHAGTSESSDTSVYYPAGTWCGVFARKGAKNNCIIQKTGGLVTLDDYAFTYNVDLKAGGIIPLQNNFVKIAFTTVELQFEPIELHIVPDCSVANKDCSATGEYFNDDGETLHKTAFNLYNFSYQQAQGLTPAKLTLTSDYKNDYGFKINQNDVVDGIQIYQAALYGLDKGTYEVTAKYNNIDT